MKSRRPLSVLLALVMLLALLPAFALTAQAAGVQITSTNFPDSVFENYVKTKFDTDSSGVLDDAEIAAAKEISITSETISSLKGIEYFTALEKLSCHGNLSIAPLASVDLSQNTALTYINLSKTEITTLDLSANTALEKLYLTYAYVDSLNLTGCSELSVLDIASTPLTALDPTQFPKLSKLELYWSGLTEVDISECPNLLDAYFSGAVTSTRPAWLSPYDPESVFPYYWEYKSEKGLLTVNKEVTVKTEKTVTVTFDANGGSGTMADETVTKGDPYTLPDCLFIAPEGKEFDKWDAGAPGETVTADADLVLVAEWKDAAPITCTVSFLPGGGSGTMTDETVTKGDAYTLPDCGFTAPEGKFFDKWDAGAPGESITVDADMTLEAQWKDLMKWNISFDAAGGSGTMEGATVIVGSKFTLPECAFTAPEGKEFDKWEQGAPGEEIDVDADLSVVAVWKDKPVETWTIKFDADGGTGTMGDVLVTKGAKFVLPECTFTAPEGKVFDRWDAGDAGAEIEVIADTTVKAVWKDKPAEIWNITFDANGGTGEMAPAAVAKGVKLVLPECAFTAPAGKEFDKWEQGKPGDEIEITEDTVVKAMWKDKAPEKKANPFVDVFETDYFYDAVIWAYYAEPQVTNGMSATEFGPKSTVTRGQAVTFLWRAMGKPEPTTTVNPFEDVPEGEYYYKAVLWAVEKGITNGTDATHFTPGQTCSTAHIITFLYRTITGQPNAGWYELAAGWAQGAGLMGDLKITVSPEVECPRADVVYFLFQALGK